MNSHKNARTTPHSRALMVRRVVAEGRTPKSVATDFGVSERTVYKWLARYRAEGRAGLENRSSRARRLAHKLPEPWVALIVKLRRAYRMTALEIAERLHVARSTVAAILKRLGLNRLRFLEPPPPIRRYERDAPGDLIHRDVKKLARFWRPGHRITGNRRGASDGAGWDYVHVCIDDHSRLAYVEVLEDEKRHTTTGFILMREWAYALPYTASQRRNADLPRWLRHYNHERPHGSLGNQPPVSRLTPAP